MASKSDQDAQEAVLKELSYLPIWYVDVWHSSRLSYDRFTNAVKQLKADGRIESMPVISYGSG